MKKKNRFINLSTYGNETKRKKGNENCTSLSGVDEWEENFKSIRNIKRTKLNKIKEKKFDVHKMNEKMKKILGIHYKYLVNDKLNQYETFWPSQLVKMGYDTGLKYDEFNEELLDYFRDNFINEYIAFYLFLSHKYDVIGNTSYDIMIYTGLCEIANAEQIKPDEKMVLNILENNYHLKLIEKSHCKFKEL